MSNAHKVRIIARLRPRIEGEVDDGAIQVCHPADNSSSSTSFSTPGTSYISVPNPRDPTELFKYPFSSCYDQASTQEEVFERDVLPLMDIVYSGVTVTIFAYGVTSSGKTHTMQGTKAQPGVIPRAVTTLFERRNAYPQYQTSLSVSYMEIYKDEVYDLLVNRENAPKLPVRECDGQVFVANLSSIPIVNEEVFDGIYTEATKNRSVGATNLNRASSRSHAVLTIEVKMLDPVRNTTLTGKLNLVDLAGSENNKMTGNDHTRMQESSAINKSLSVLGKVVHALNSGQSRIPYRESKLTRILQDALGGSSLGLLICNLAPGVRFRSDTVNTLKFATQTKKIENKPVVNEQENRPVVKPHFAALNIHRPPQQPVTVKAIATQPTAPAPPPLEERPIPIRRGRPSLVPPMTAPLMQIPEGIATSQSTGSGFSGLGLTEEEINERISKAVEVEVARRLEEREREREVARMKEGEERAAAERASVEASSGSGSGTPSRRRSRTRSKSRSPRKEEAKPLPPGVLTPLLKRHKDMDNELQARLQELEKNERGDKEAKLVAALSPVSKKKTGRAYVALARAHSEKGDLQVALDLYRKAETYVPDNIKLKERIIEIEWAVKNERPFVPSPKRTKNKKTKAERKLEKKSGRDRDRERDGAEEEGEEEEKENPPSDDQMDVDEVATSLFGQFGVEITNAGVGAGAGSSPNKRRLEDDDDLEEQGTPAKRAKMNTKVVVYGSDDEEPLAAPTKKGKRKLLV
ncbi:hypothetical protein AAF712_004703 [Marasmius tenuissimus]|uniref:Kinesin-like protein n=1 Tax=Marasmius tenuissimus TaxID=585030 RepID=A0ABR3A2U8_9AGAR